MLISKLCSFFTSSRLLSIFMLLLWWGKAECASPYTGTTTVFVSYSNASENTNLEHSPSINVGFNGSGHYTQFTMDTGSVGIVASSDIFTPARGAKYLGTGRQIYSSSGIIEEGTWWSATQEIYDEQGNLVATANVPVLLVTSISCTDDARSCEPNNHPTGVALMGVGFARESPQQERGTPNYNAFLNLTKVLQNGVLKPLPSDWCNGYVVCPNGVYLGLTSTNTANAGFVKLLPWTTYSTPTLSEWMPAPMTVKANSVSGNGNILMDTGVGDGFLTPAPGGIVNSPVMCPLSTLEDCVADGNVIKTYLPNETNPVAYYTFTVGDNANPMHPDGIHLGDDPTIFFNTSRHVLGGINFLYDNTNGYIGYIWNGNSSSDIGYVNPAVVSSVTVLGSSNNPAKPGKNVTFTATAVGVDTSQVPTGGITFVVDGAQEYVPLTNGQATLSTSQLAKGKHTIVAKYSGDSTFVRSVSQTLIEKIK